jgi:hypothetical protein
MRFSALVASAAAGTMVLAVACGGGSDSKKTPTSSAGTTPAPTAARTSATTAAAKPATTAPARTATTASRAATSASGTTPSAANTPAATTGGAEFDATQAQALLDEASLLPRDIGADWAITADSTTDNAAAAAADAAGAPSFERCGRLLGRLVTNGPKDVVSAYLGGTIVAAFSQLTVYKTAAGAADCATEGATRFAQPGALARAFGTIFVNPDAVTVQQLEYPQIGNGSFAAALTGDINASGQTVQLQIVIVAFRNGNTTAVVGVAYAPLTTPSTKELKPYVDLVAGRIAANQ